MSLVLFYLKVIIVNLLGLNKQIKIMIYKIINIFRKVNLSPCCKVGMIMNNETNTFECQECNKQWC